MIYPTPDSIYLRHYRGLGGSRPIGLYGLVSGLGFRVFRGELPSRKTLNPKP